MCTAAERGACFYHKHKDHGATYFFNTTEPDPTLPLYRDRPSMALYITRNSAKLSYLVYLVNEICNVHGRKVIIFCDWPSSAWLVEVLMLILGFNIFSIRAKHKQREREEAVNSFNDPTCPVQVLVLQKHCSDVIFLDVPSKPFGASTQKGWSSTSLEKRGFQ